MTTYGAVEGWGSGLSLPAGVVRLTRRGRLVRAGLIVGLLALLAITFGGSLTAAPISGASRSSAPAASTQVVIVRQGDSLWAIAREVQPQADPREVVTAIRELNGLSANMIHPGQELLVPLPG